MADLTGRSLGRYHIIEKLGEGGMAVVYKAYDTRLESDVAVKVIRTENLAPSILERALKRFEREAKALAKLTHANIVKVLDYGEYEGKPYLVMPYLPGGTLKTLLKGQPIPWADAARWLIPIARALSYAHSERMIHRDVKPSNILITKTGDPMLTDFGIAKIIDEEMTVDLTGTSAAVGTPEYMAPEQVTSKNVDHRVDIYALGIVFYEMVTGHKPYVADTPMAVLFKHASEPLPRPKSFVPTLPDAIEKVLLKALAKGKENRYQSMDELAIALEQLSSEKQAAIPTTTISTTDSLDTQPVEQITWTQPLTTDAERSLETSTQIEESHSNKRFTWAQAIAIGVAVAGFLMLCGLTLFGIPRIQAMLNSAAIPTLTEKPLIFNSPTVVTSVPAISPYTRAPSPTNILISPSPASVNPGYPLEDCRISRQDICLYSISPQPNRLIVSLKSKVSFSNLPYLSVGDFVLPCITDSINYPGRLICENTKTIPAGEYQLTLRYSEAENICTGFFQINNYTAPVPATKKPGGGKYP